MEFVYREELRKKPVREITGYGAHSQPPGTWSDDTSLTLCLVESLVKAGYDLAKSREEVYPVIPRRLLDALWEGIRHRWRHPAGYPTVGERSDAVLAGPDDDFTGTKKNVTCQLNKTP